MNRYIMLVDDNALFRTALSNFLMIQDNIAATVEVARAEDMIALYRQYRIDVVCMDMDMQGIDGSELTRKLLLTEPNAKIIGLSGHADLNHVARMVLAGAKGYVIKGSQSGELLGAIEAVCQNQLYFDSALGVSAVNDWESYLLP